MRYYVANTFTGIESGYGISDRTGNKLSRWLASSNVEQRSSPSQLSSGYPPSMTIINIH